MSEWLGITDMNTDLPGKAVLELSELPFQVTIAAADEHELCTRCDERLGRIDDQIETFLRVQATHDNEDRA